MNEVLATASQSGAADLFFKVRKVNQSAVDFCSQKGFRLLSEEKFRVGARDYPALLCDSR
jgi:hypothetical protein